MKNRKFSFKRPLALLMVCAMTASFAPAAVYAAAEEQAQSTDSVEITVTGAEESATYTVSYAKEAVDGYTQIGETGVYYAVDGLDLSQTLIARRNVTWDQLYQDAAGLEDAGFDVITTATVSSAVDGGSWNAWSTTKDTDADGEDDATVIQGSKVPVRLSAQTYVESLVLAYAGVGESLAQQTANLALSGLYTADSGTKWAKSNLYYQWNADATDFELALPATINTVPADAAISDSTNWGDYLVTVTDAEGLHYVKTGRTDTTEYDPVSTDAEILAGYQLGNSTMYAATFETNDGKVYTMGYLENMWSASYEFSFRIAEDTAMTHMGKSTNYEQYTDIAGKTITKLTYYGAYGVYVYDLSSFDLKVKAKQTASATGDAEVSVVSGKDAVIHVDLSALESSNTYQLTGVSYGSGRNATALEAGDYSYDAAAGTVTIAASAVTENPYKLTFSDTNSIYATVTHSVTLTVAAASSGDNNTNKDNTSNTSNTNNTNTGANTTTTPKAGTKLTKGTNTYTVLKAGKTVAYAGTTNKKATSVTIPATVKINGITYKVTSIAAKAFKGNTKLTKAVIGKNVTTIGKKAFFNCKSLKKITIKSTYLKAKNVGANAFKKAGSRNYKKLVVKVPSAKKAAYKKILKAKGLCAKATVK